MTQKERIEQLEAEVTALKARLAAVEARPVYPYLYWQVSPNTTPTYPTWFSNGTSPNGYGTFSAGI